MPQARPVGPAPTMTASNVSIALQHPLDARINLRQRARQRRRILAARLGHVRPASALAAHRLRHGAGQLARVNLRRSDPW